MKIGIDASRAFIKNRTGIEEYSYQVIKNLLRSLKGHRLVLYIRKNQKVSFDEGRYKNLEIREIRFRRFWTQIGLAFEMIFSPVDVLFVPAHTVPWMHPKKTVVTIHGLEYEHCKESYSFYSRMMHRFFIKRSCQWAKKIIAVSKKTKEDLIGLYRAEADKIKVIYNGFSRAEPKIMNQESRKKETSSQFVLYIGRLEKRKNIEGIVKIFEILKGKYSYPGKLILAGRPGFGYDAIKNKIQKTKSKKFIIEKGFIDDNKKWQLMKGADVFLFPSLSEGFGIPILEAQGVGTPVVTSNFGPMDEVAGDEDILMDPWNYQIGAELINKLVTNKVFREEAIEKGFENTKRFSWEKSGKKVGELLLSV